MQQIVALDRKQVWASILGSAACTFVTTLFQNSMTGEVSVSILVGAALVGAVAGLLVARMVIGKPAPQTPEPQTPEPVQLRIVGSGGVAVALRESEPPQRVFSPRSLSELVALRKGKTEIASNATIKPHIGTWLQYQGPVVDVRSHYSGEGMEIVLQHSVDEPGIFAWFDPSWSKRIEILDIGDQVTVTGKIKSILSNLIVLEKCEMG